MYYHASPTGSIRRLEPRVSNHGVPLVYFSKKRENVLVYLSNAVEKYCRETGFPYEGRWQKWGPYGFDRDGVQRLEEYYPDALEKTYAGVPGYIYRVRAIAEADFELGIPDAAVSRLPVDVDADAVEYVPDACEALLRAEREGRIAVTRYAELPEARKSRIAKTIREEYERAADHPEYRHFLRGNFPELFGG